jgi:hypothetical protein
MHRNRVRCLCITNMLLANRINNGDFEGLRVFIPYMVLDIDTHYLAIYIIIWVFCRSGNNHDKRIDNIRDNIWVY